MTSEPPAVDGRRHVIRTLFGGGVLAAAMGSGAFGVGVAEAAPAEGMDPFADNGFRPNGCVREYWIQAESFLHNAVPNGVDGMTGRQFSADQTSFWAIGFRACTPDWGRPLDPDLGPDGIGANSGIPGPVIRAEVGDTVRVHFRNNDEHYRWPHSIHPHGVHYDPDSDGGWLADDPQKPGTAVQFGDTYTYTWTCGPSSVGTWPYHDHAAPQSLVAGGGPVMEIGAELGLFGVIAVTDRQTPKVDREFVLFFHEVDRDEVPGPLDIDMFNGGAFVDNTPTFTARVGERVRWRIAALGKEFHVFHLHGHRWRSDQGYQGWVDSQLLGPSSTLTVEYTEDNPGDWLYHCHVTDHMMGGMVGRYRVTP